MREVLQRVDICQELFAAAILLFEFLTSVVMGDSVSAEIFAIRSEKCVMQTHEMHNFEYMQVV